MSTDDIIHSLVEDRMGVTIEQACHIQDILRIVKEDGDSPRTYRKLLVLLGRVESEASLPHVMKIIELEKEK